MMIPESTKNRHVRKSQERPEVIHPDPFGAILTCIDAQFVTEFTRRIGDQVHLRIIEHVILMPAVGVVQSLDGIGIIDPIDALHQIIHCRRLSQHN